LSVTFQLVTNQICRVPLPCVHLLATRETLVEVWVIVNGPIMLVEDFLFSV